MAVKFPTTIILLLLLCLAMPAMADKPNPWAPRQQCLFGMPFLGHAVKPQQTGLLTEMFKLIYEPEDILLRHERLPYLRALEGVRSGKLHVTLDIKTDRKGVLQSKGVMATYDLAVAYKFKTGFEDLKSLKDKRVAYLHGFGLEEFVPVQFMPQLVYDLTSAFHMLDRGHVTYVLGDNALLRDAIFDSRLPSGQYVITDISTHFVRPIFADTEEGRLLRDVYDRRMKELIAKGDLQDFLIKQGLSMTGIEKVIDANK